MKKQPTQKQLEARKRFAEQARARGKFEIEVKLNDKVFNCKTNDLEGAFVILGTDTKAIKTKMILKIKKGQKIQERVITVPRVRRLFINTLFRKIFVQNLKKAFT